MLSQLTLQDNPGIGGRCAAAGQGGAGVLPLQLLLLLLLQRHAAAASAAGTPHRLSHCLGPATLPCAPLQPAAGVGRQRHLPARAAKRKPD